MKLPFFIRQGIVDPQTLTHQGISTDPHGNEFSLSITIGYPCVMGLIK